ncbi:hypothetical protein BsWGS_27735 [Bradybaena similaris]
MEVNRGGIQEVIPHNISPSYTSESSRYFEYPGSKPFVNSEYTSGGRPVDAHPKSNRDAIITALRNLQDKIKDLEIERTTAEKNLQSLAQESEPHKKVLQDRRPAQSKRTQQDKQTEGHGDIFLTQTRKLEGQLSSSERRCQGLEEQLGQMRKMVENSERNQRNLLEQVGKTRQEKDINGAEIKQHMDRLNELEKDQKRLTTTQTIAESKIRELEKNIKEENMHRRTLQEKTQQLELETHPKKISTSYQMPMMPSEKAIRAQTTQVIKTKKPTKKKKKVVHTSGPAGGTCRGEPMRHYRLNLAEIPFVAGKSTAPSHALGANVQKVLAMMKRHNNALCSHMESDGDSQRPDSASSTGSSASSGVDHDLSDLMVQLQDEFGHLCSKHQELVNQLQATKDSGIQRILEEELDVLVQSMKIKSQQISRIRQHQKKVDEIKKIRSQPVKRSEKSKRPQSAPVKNIQHHTNRTKPKTHSCNKPIGHSALGKPALFMLRDMKKLQKTLRKDEPCWE